MIKNIYILLFVIISANSNAQLVNLQSCKSQPAFIFKKGFNARRTVISTSEKKYPGLVIYEMADSTENKDIKPKFFQDTTWKKYGSMGTFCFDEKGNIYTIPVPWVNVLNNAKQHQNTVYKVDAITGIMAPLIHLPIHKKYNPQNAYGLLGISYDCTTKSLYVSTVGNADRNTENGTIYCIDLRGKNAAIKDSLKGKDILGLAMIGFTNKTKTLLAGSARNSSIYAVLIDSTGRFKEHHLSPLLTLENLGARGDDKARKFEVTNNGDLLVKAVEFNYNLIAPTEQQQTYYTFRFNQFANKFELVYIKSFEELEQYN